MLSTVFSHKFLLRSYVLFSSLHHSWPKRELLDLNLYKIVYLWTTSLAFSVPLCLSLLLLFAFSIHFRYFLSYLSWQKQACLCVSIYLCCFLSVYHLPPWRYCYPSRTKACSSIFPALKMKYFYLAFSQNSLSPSPNASPVRSKMSRFSAASASQSFSCMAVEC